MDSRRRVEIPVKGPRKEPDVPELEKRVVELLPKTKMSFESRLIDIAERPRRIAPLHWAAFFLSLVSLAISIIWVTDSTVAVTSFWLWLDIGLCAFFAVEFFTRSGFNWDKDQYALTHFFDFIAIVPVLVLVYYTKNVPHLYIWMWLILIARGGRAIDRLLGDGFIRRNVFALAEGFEEEITDRVLLRVMARIQADLGRGKFGTGVSEALIHNKESVLGRVRAAHPHEGLGASLAQFVGLEAALARAEERTYDAIVEVLGSPEVDQAIQEAVDSAFNTMRAEITVKSWREHLGVKPGKARL